MIVVLEPQNEVIKQFVDSIYVFRKGEEKLDFTAYPSTNTPVGLFRNAAVTVCGGSIHVHPSHALGHFAMVCHPLSGGIRLHYAQMVDEIAINFKALGLRSHTRSQQGDGIISCFHDWDDGLPTLFHNVFATHDSALQLHHIETFLLARYAPLAEQATLLSALQLLNDTTTDHKMQEIATLAGVHYKQLYRLFTEYIGCSPAHYRKLVKFRGSIVSKLKKGAAARLVDICYDNAYTDQPYFTKQFKELSGQRPARFFKEVTSFGNDKVIFRLGDPDV